MSFSSQKRKYNFAIEEEASKSCKTFKKEAVKPNPDSFFKIDLSQCQNRTNLLATFQSLEEVYWQDVMETGTSLNPSSSTQLTTGTILSRILIILSYLLFIDLNEFFSQNEIISNKKMKRTDEEQEIEENLTEFRKSISTLEKLEELPND